MKIFPALLLSAFCVGAVFSSALPEESAVPAPADETATTVPEAPAAPTETTTAVPEVQPTPTAQPGKPGKGPKPPKDATIAEAKELERKLEKALKESRGKLERFNKALGETREVALAKLIKIKDELLVKAKEAKKEGKKGLRKVLIRNVVILDQLKIRLSKLR